jgi:flagellar basal-body rod protein FlgB
MLNGVTERTERYLNLLSARQKLVAANIANADTPGYKTKDIDFQEEFQSLVNGQQPRTIEAAGLQVKADGNNVNIDRETRLLAENAIRFNLASTLLRGDLKGIRDAIQEKTS